MHLAVAFIDSPHSHVRRVRTVEAMAHIAISIVGGAISTLGSSFFLFFCAYACVSPSQYLVVSNVKACRCTSIAAYRGSTSF